MNLIFFIRSSTVNLNNYHIKDIPGTTGRLDVISRCIIAALLDENEFEEYNQIWVFLDEYGTKKDFNDYSKYKLFEFISFFSKISHIFFHYFTYFILYYYS